MIDLADEIAYNCADLDDGYSARILALPDIVNAVPSFALIFETIETQYPGASEREQFQEALRNLVDSLVSGLIEGTAAAANRAGVRNHEEVRRNPSRIAAFTQESGQATKALKSLLRRKLYSSTLLEEDRGESTRKMAEMFEYFHRAS